MKTLFKILSLIILFGSEIISQQSSSIKFIGTANKFQLEGIGNIIGSKGDNARLAYWAITDTSAFETKIYIKSLNAGKAGVIVRDANNVNNLQGGRPCYFFYLDKESSKLKLDVRNVENSLLNNVFELNNIVAPVWLSIKKINRTVTIAYSKEAETVGEVSWINLTTINQIPKYNSYVRGAVVASKSNTVKNVLIASNWKESVSNSNFVFNNPFKNVNYETSLEVYSPQKFPNISSLMSKSYDPLVNTDVYNWSVMWQVDGLMFKNNNRTLNSVGILGTPDYNPIFNNGIGTRCSEFIYTFNPDNGCSWGQTRNTSGECIGTITNIDPVCNTTYLNFTSTVPFTNRYFSLYGNSNSWNNLTNENAYDEGVSSSSSTMLGLGDKINNKYNTLYSGADIENGEENGGSKITSFLLGMSRNTRGYAFSKYTQIFNTLGYISSSAYPDINGNYPLNPDINQSWTTSIKVTIPSKGITNLGLIDDKKIAVGGEVSIYSQSTFYQGTQYDKTGNGNFVTVNKFGTGANVEHYLARLINNLEIQRWYIDNKLDSRKAITMTKTVCDRGNFGLPFDESNTSLQFKHIDRRTAVMVGLMTFLHKHEWLIWDRNLTGKNLDCYNGVFGVLNLLHQKKSFGITSKSAVDLYPYLIADNWNTEISYNGISWTKHKGSDIQLSPNNLPCRTMATSDGYWIVGCVRPEKIEPTDVYIRKTIAGVTQTLHITPNMWQSTNPTYASGTVSIPDSDKDYYFNILKINN